MKVVEIQKDDWMLLSEKAHLIVFNEAKMAATDRIDFALVTENSRGELMNYVTCRELDSESLYWQYGGSFPGTKGSILSLRAVQALLEYCKSAGYARVGFFVENTNSAMLKMAMKCGFLITGVRNFKGIILLEHYLEFA